MTVATANEDSLIVVQDEANRVNWSAVFVGVVIAIAATFLLLALGSGIGLSLVNAGEATGPRFLTLGAIYFLAAQAFGLAIGAHVTGRLIGPRLETTPEEEFRAAAHGLAVWGFAAIVTAFIVIVSGWVAAGSAGTLDLLSGGNSSAASSVTPNVAGYWTDMLFRPAAAEQHAALNGLRYAQADTGTQNDANPAQSVEQPPAQPMQSVPNTTPPATEATPAPEQTAPPTTTNTAPTPERRRSPLTEIPAETPTTTPESQEAQPRNVAADKTEVGRILEVGMAKGGTLSPYDKLRIANLIAADTDVGLEQSMRRINDAEATIHQDETQAAEFARKSARNASLWIAFALLFGAIVAAVAAASARWEDDAVTFGRRRREPA